MVTQKKSSKCYAGSRPAQARPRAVRRRPQPSPPAPVDPRFIEGVALFNHRQFFACHEVLEQLWLKTQGRPRDFYKGLIQAAVACYHWSRNNSAGAMSLYRSSSRYLRKYRPECLGLDVEQFLRQYTELFGWLRRHHVRYEDRLVPTLRWTHTPRVS